MDRDIDGPVFVLHMRIITPAFPLQTEKGLRRSWRPTLAAIAAVGAAACQHSFGRVVWTYFYEDGSVGRGTLGARDIQRRRTSGRRFGELPAWRDVIANDPDALKLRKNRGT